MTPKMQKALLALLTHPTKESAAAAAGITSKTLRKFLDDPGFQAEYRAAYSRLVDDAVRQAQKSLSPAIKTLNDIMQDTEANGQIRVSAARSLLEFSLKATEQLDILDRLTELEAAMGGEHG